MISLCKKKLQKRLPYTQKVPPQYFHSKHINGKFMAKCIKHNDVTEIIKCTLRLLILSIFLVHSNNLLQHTSLFIFNILIKTENYSILHLPCPTPLP